MIWLYDNYIDLLVGFESRFYSSSESLGTAKIVITLSGGLSAIPLSIMVTTIEKTAKGEKCVSNQHIVSTIAIFWFVALLPSPARLVNNYQI